MEPRGDLWKWTTPPVSRQNSPTQHKCLHLNRSVVLCFFVTSAQLKRWLRKQGCTFEPGKGGHLIVRRGDRMSVLPMHGSGKELGTGLVHAVKKDLGL